MDIEDSEDESPKPDPYLTIEGEKCHKSSTVTVFVAPASLMSFVAHHWVRVSLESAKYEQEQ